MNVWLHVGIERECNWQEGAVQERWSYLRIPLSHQAAVRRQGLSVFVQGTYLCQTFPVSFSLPFCEISFVHVQSEEEIELYPQPVLP